MSETHQPTNSTRTDWASAPVLLIPRPACPHCGHEKYDRTRTNANGDGTSTKLCTCRACGGHYKICDEFPDSGIEIIWPL
jgi:DNA-directed RNA polymerase subunit M/transcription elongation factor TFIIS